MAVWWKRSSKSTIPALSEQLDTANIRLQIRNESALYKQVQIIGITKEDVAFMPLLQPYVHQNIQSIVTGFYETITQSDHLRRIIEDNNSIQRLQQTLRNHIVELFSGKVDHAFIDARLRIASVHARIGLEPQWYLAGYQYLLNRFMDLIERHIESKTDALRAVQAVTKMINLEQQIVMEAYEDENERYRRDTMQAEEQLKKKISETAQYLATIGEQTSASIEEVTAKTEDVSQNTKRSSALATQSIREADQVNDHLQQLRADMSHIASRATSLFGNMRGLEEMAGQIDEIIGIVQGIAEQTNLLALNAAIEAARAGEHGQGFAVVADEVRKLADQTSESVERVSGLVAQTNDHIRANVTSVEDVQERITKGNRSTQEVTSFFERIDHVWRDAQQQSVQTERDMEEFVQVMNEIASGATNVAASADELLHMTRSKSAL